jgi:VanZ family protein
MSLPHDSRRNAREWRWGAVSVLVIYWVIMFAGTHAPSFGPRGTGFSDDILHLTGFAGLGFLLGICLAPRTWKGYLAIWLLCVAYGAFDELTQPLVGRDRELTDWFADCLGAGMGLALSFAARAVWSRGKLWIWSRGGRSRAFAETE